MPKLTTPLDGYKVYIAAAITIAWAIFGLVRGFISPDRAGELIFLAVSFMGIAHKGNRTRDAIDETKQSVDRVANLVK